MGRRIAAALVILALCIGGFYVWQHYRQQQQGTDGDVKWDEGQPTPEQKAAFDKENSGDTADGQSEHKTRTARAEDAAGNPQGMAATGQPTPAAAPSTATATTPVMPGQTTTYNNVPPASAKAAAPVPAQVATPAAASNSMQSLPAGLPVSDSLSPNAPNGMRFVSSGKFQWYRQGNITWREDTETGRSCVAYATLEEWAKQIVYSHGCGRNI